MIKIGYTLMNNHFKCEYKERHLYGAVYVLDGYRNLNIKAKLHVLELSGFFSKSSSIRVNGSVTFIYNIYCRTHTKLPLRYSI